ncbi:MAG: hypothetical protein ABDH59_01945 [Fervidobacterium sp.]
MSFKFFLINVKISSSLKRSFEKKLIVDISTRNFRNELIINL